jgi:hypothetical protein
MMAGRREDEVVAAVDPDESPFELPAIEGLPFSDDSEEARAIERVLEEAAKERGAASDDS